MTMLPSADEAAIQKDTEQLKMLSIFWYILAAIQAVGGCIGLSIVGFGLLSFFGIASSGRADDAAAGGVFGGFFGCFGLFILVIWWGLALLNFKVARSLPKRKSRGLCLAMAAILCLGFPLGTILGVFTLMVLSRPSVKSMTT